MKDVNPIWHWMFEVAPIQINSNLIYIKAENNFSTDLVHEARTRRLRVVNSRIRPFKDEL